MQWPPHHLGIGTASSSHERSDRAPVIGIDPPQGLGSGDLQSETAEITGMLGARLWPSFCRRRLRPELAASFMIRGFAGRQGLTTVKRWRSLIQVGLAERQIERSSTGAPPLVW